jgi:hypothetical protein
VTRKEYLIQTEPKVICSCSFFANYGMLCRHLAVAAPYLQFELLDAISGRWLRSIEAVKLWKEKIELADTLGTQMMESGDGMTKIVEYGDDVTHNQAVPQSPKKKAIEKSVLVAKGHMKTLHSYLEQNEAYASMIASTLEELLSDFQTTDSIMNESIANVKKKGRPKLDHRMKSWSEGISIKSRTRNKADQRKRSRIKQNPRNQRMKSILRMNPRLKARWKPPNLSLS